MKLSKVENQKLSDSIDHMQEALDVFIDLYNQSEDDVFHVKLEDDVIELIHKAKHVLGAEIVNQKVNTLIKEVLSFLPLYEISEQTAKNHDEENKAT
ncbi:hypothetical protein [Calidifontibacillus oryziterrae]|uniref:hypothetical protein n=1 Tax=Calidifontibacillus oryziterrae TaxID=1191699 RepID=UPI0002DD8230|nr:hypothetical protein [Calidifontibacillus oryziterrae]